MSTATATQPAPAMAPAAVRGASLRHALHAEWTKLRTVSGPAWLLLGLAAATIAVSAAAVGATHCPQHLTCPVDTTKLSLTGIQFGQAVVAILAVLTVSNEYSSGMMRVTVAAMPRRSAVLAAKAILLAALVLAAGAVAVFGSVLAGHLILPGHGFTAARGFHPVWLSYGPTLRAASGSVLYLGLIALMSLGVAVIVRDSAVSIGVVLGAAVPVPDHPGVHRERALAAPARAVDTHGRGADHPGHHRPAEPGDHSVGRAGRAGDLGRSRDAGRRPGVPVPRRLARVRGGGPAVLGRPRLPGQSCRPAGCPHSMFRWVKP